MSGPRTTQDAYCVPTWLLASCAAALSIAAHGSAGGAVGDSALTVLLTAVLAWGGTSLARRGGLLPLVAVLATTQAAQHVLLTEIAHVHAAGPAVDGRLMFATHAVATLLSAVLLIRAGSALAGIAAAVRWLVGRLQSLCAAPTTGPVRSGPAAAPVRPGVLLEVLLRRVSPRRGPPTYS